MHKIAEKEFMLGDFSTEHLIDASIPGVEALINYLNVYREAYIETKDKKYWWQLIQLLPSSYNQTRNVMLNYEVLANIYKSRRGHKLDEWRELCEWIESLPYSELIMIAAGLDDNSINARRGLARQRDAWPERGIQALGESVKVYDTKDYAKEHPEWVDKIQQKSKES